MQYYYLLHVQAGEMFPNYEVRGKMFKEYVNKLGE